MATDEIKGAVDQTPAADPPVYALAELKANAMAIFKVQPEVIDGALYNSTKQEFTVAELQALIDKFLKRKVK